MTNTEIKFELRNFKYSAFATQETPCFEAKLYIDGKFIADVRNEGHGGCNYVYPNPKLDAKEVHKIAGELEYKIMDRAYLLHEVKTKSTTNKNLKVFIMFVLKVNLTAGPQPCSLLLIMVHII